MASSAAMIHITPQKSAFTRRQSTNIISKLRVPQWMRTFRIVLGPRLDGLAPIRIATV